MPAPFTRFQRILLGTDGTVTHILETYAGEPIEVVKLVQEFDTSGAGDGPLDLADDAKVLRRTVVLQGRASGLPLIHAEVAVAPDRVDASFLDGLLATETPIGALLAQQRVETLREILDVRTEPAGPRAEHFGVDATETVIARTYRIVAHGQPIVLITERFPASAFRDLPA